MWSLVYVMVELRGKLPWNNLTEKKELAEAKRLAEKRDLFGECSSQIRDLAIMLRKMDYWARPDYYEIYRMFLRAMNEGGYKFSDPWDWQMKEHKAKVAAAASGTPSKASKKSKTSTKCPESEKKVESEMELPPENPFTDDDFDKNPLGL
ncbi:hypothetical protein PFISCL1PPCAC_1348 [Pristionchus fissidentatus]|uniref:Protein kinase domain-containing protein n=1 Tax=Pristionchus fissidentatus TaxID=1538716 RepID=A0AAV5USD8_9BILA|nr:hypothetical protein PFISCL1PPCAC_1348 [Pristionchus fissidentatus]